MKIIKPEDGQVGYAPYRSGSTPAALRVIFYKEYKRWWTLQGNVLPTNRRVFSTLEEALEESKRLWSPIVN